MSRDFKKRHGGPHKKRGDHGARQAERGGHERHDRTRHHMSKPVEPVRPTNAETRWVGGFEAVAAALQATPYDCRALWIEHELQNESIGEIVRRAKDLDVEIQYMARPELDRAVNGGKHQGVALRVVFDPMETFGEWIRSLDDARKKGLVVVALDQIQDPHNLGAIARSALQLGARCMVAPERRSSPVTQAAVQSSAGAVLKIPVHRVVNLAQTLALCKENGFWVYGADAAGKDAWDATLNTPCVLVIGSEGYGLRPLVRASCEELLRIPQVAHGVGSLNASCAATALLYEIARQKAKPVPEMSGEHHHAGEREERDLGPLTGAIALTSVIFFAELAGGWWTGSLALIADATHMAVDILGLGLSLFAAMIAALPADPKRTYGYRRVEVLAALGNAIALMVATGFILREAWARWSFPTPVAAGPMLAVAVLGLAANLGSAALLWKSSRENINLRGALFHVLTDAAGSVGAILAALLILRTRWYEADALVSALICVGIVATAGWLLRDSIHILLEGAPPHLDLEEVRAALGGLDGVKEVHDLHLWSVTQGQEAMSGHLVVADGREACAVLKAGRELLEARFGLTHVTLQVEPEEHAG